jgi:L-fuconate dehydratase
MLSKPSRWVARTKPSAADQAIAPQSLMLALRTVRRVVAITARFGVPVCPHAGGVGLCEMVRHLAMFDYLAVSGSLDGRMIEYVDHLHEHFLDPVVLRNGRYLAPTAPGFSAQMRPQTLIDYCYPTGCVWSEPPLVALPSVTGTGA